MKMLIKLVKAVFNLIVSLFNFIFRGLTIIVIFAVDHIIIGLFGGAFMGLYKGGSGLFGMGLRSTALKFAAKTTRMP